MKIKKHFTHFNWKKKKGIIILDDIFPSPLSPWRNNEYAAICSYFKDVVIYTDTSTYKHYNQNLNYNENLEILTDNYPSLNNKIFQLKKITNINYELAYMLFYNNIIKYFHFLERNKTNFVFTLYPGGGFGFNDSTIDNNLKRICASKYFKGVIVNQNCTKSYLIEKNICSENQVELIFGVPLNLETSEIENYKYQKANNQLSVLFFGNKYTPNGADKGFDVFLKVVALLYNKINNINFIVIGGFSEEDVTISSIKNVIDFKGTLNEFQFNEILLQTHILLSANIPFTLSQNAFDGFPLATCVTASLYGNLNLMTDYFNESEKINLIDNVDYIKVDSDEKQIAEIIKKLDSNRELLKEIALQGRNKILHLYNYENQITKRIDFFKKILN